MTAKAGEEKDSKGRFPLKEEMKSLRDLIEKEKCEAVYFLNHHELTGPPAETMRTQIKHLMQLEEDLKEIESAPEYRGYCGQTARFFAVSTLGAFGAGVSSVIGNTALTLIVSIMFLVILSVVWLTWEQLCCRDTPKQQLRHARAYFHHIRSIRIGQMRNNRKWEVTSSALSSHPRAQAFWRDAFGFDVIRVPWLRFSKELLNALVMDAPSTHEEPAKVVDVLWKNKIAAVKLIKVCAGEASPYVDPLRFRGILCKLGPFESMLSNILDFLNGHNEFAPWFFPVALTQRDLLALGEKWKDEELPWMSFFVHPAPLKSHFEDHAFRLVRYTKSSMKFAGDHIYRSSLGYHVSMTGTEIKKVFRHEARILHAVAEVTGFPENVLDILVDQISVAPPVFDLVGDLIAFYRNQNKLSVPVPFLKQFRFT
ncbi:hypothetical protein AAMO2058_001016000 [Amorphochlora amoebiformis]|uniref:Uncharacterized protein n=1 Tax=Amorphochlora amoebiformis TaxID=1561963 RepID=A0A6T6XJM0_9EUKA